MTVRTENGQANHVHAQEVADTQTWAMPSEEPVTAAADADAAAEEETVETGAAQSNGAPHASDGG